jgi:hypothetical protein
MLLESLEEGIVRWKKMDTSTNNNKDDDEEEESQWYSVGTVIGEIIEDENEDDGDGEVEEWTWQAYLDEDD